MSDKWGDGVAYPPVGFVGLSCSSVDTTNLVCTMMKNSFWYPSQYGISVQWVIQVHGFIIPDLSCMVEYSDLYIVFGSLLSVVPGSFSDN